MFIYTAIYLYLYIYIPTYISYENRAYPTLSIVGFPNPSAILRWKGMNS